MNIKKIALFGCGGLLVLFIILGIIFFFVFRNVGAQASTFMSDLCNEVNQGGTNVNSYLSQAWLSTAQSQTYQMKSLIKGCSSFSVSSISHTNNGGAETLTAQGTLHFASKDSSTIPLTINLVKESSVWKLISMSEQ